MTRLAHLPARGVIEVSGEDRVGFLQGLVSNDVNDARPGRAVWAALLTPQGKYLADFFIFDDGKRLLLEAEAAQVALVTQRLTRYRLRSRVAIAPAPFAVYAAWDGVPDIGATIAAPDPRLAEAGWRLLSATLLDASATEDDYDLHRLSLGLPDGSRDLEPEKTVLLEAGFDELNGVSWSKGCYMGQELTARTKYRGLLKRRLMPVSIDGPLPAPGTPVLRDGAEVGTMRSGRGGFGLALLRLEAQEGPLDCAAAKLAPRRLAWAAQPRAAD